MQRDVTAGWKESAQYWDKHTGTLAAMFSPITEAIIRAAKLAPGHRVLDVAGGTGEPTISIAPLVGVSGRVVCTDVAPVMVRATRRRAAELGLTQVRLVECSGDALPFAKATFHRAVCRLGVMFFGDPDAGVAELARAVEPGGVVVLAVWSYKERNPFFGLVSDIASEIVPWEPDPPGTPNAWRFAEEGLLASSLKAAGCDQVVEARVPFTIRMENGFDAFWEMRVEMSDTLRAKLGSPTSDLSREVGAKVREALSRYTSGEVIELPAEVLIVSGRAHAKTPRRNER